MAAANVSTSLVPVQPVFTDAERLALAGYLAGYRGLTREAYTLDLRQFTGWCRARSLPLFSVRRADIETFARELEATRPGPRHRHPPAVHDRRVLQVRRRGRAPRPLARRARPPAAGGLRVARHRPGPQRGRRAPGRRRARPGRRARADLPAGPQRAAGVGGDRRGHRAPWPRARPPDPGDHPQGRQGRHHPARPAHRPRDRPGDRRAHRAGRCSSPPTAGGWTGTAPPGSSAGSPAAPGSPSRSARTRCGTRSSPPPSTPGSRCGTCRKPPRTPTRAPPCATTGPGPASTGTPPTSSPPTSPEQPDSPAGLAVRRWPGRWRETLPVRLPGVANDNDREPPIGAVGDGRALCCRRTQNGAFCRRTPLPDRATTSASPDVPMLPTSCGAGCLGRLDCLRGCIVVYGLRGFP